MTDTLRSETPDLGSVYDTPEQAGGSNERAIAFKQAVEEAKSKPYVIDFESIVSDASRTTGTNISEVCAKRVAEIAHDGGVRFFTDDPEMAQVLGGINRIGISRSSIAESSAHKVFFASLVNGSAYRVAVKSFVPNEDTKTGYRDKTVKEWTNTLFARRLSLEVFAPMGFLLVDNYGFVITERKDDLDPMDNVDWTSALEYPQQDSMLEDMRKIGPSLARLHELGCYHGDPQLKNVVLTQTGSVRFIDWESSTFVDPRIAVHPNVYHKVFRDLKVLFGSLARQPKDEGVGLLSRKLPAVQSQLYDELILTPYVDERMRLVEHKSAQEQDVLLGMLASVHSEMTAYIENEELAASLSRSRRGRE